MTLRLSTYTQNMLAGDIKELVTNGTFDSASTGWTASTATVAYASGAVDGRSNTLKVNGSAGYAYQSVTVLPGHLYRLQFRAYNTAGNGYVNVGPTSGTSTTFASGNLAATAWASLTSAGATVSSGLASTYFVTTSTQTAAVIQLGTDGTGDHHYDDISLVCLSTSLRDIFEYAQLKIYTGSQPSDPDNAVTGTLLVTISNAGTGMTWDDATDGVIAKTSGETWSGTCVATGTAGWWRLCFSGDGGSADSTYDWPRMDGSVGTSGADLNFTSTSFTSASTQTVSDIEIEIPIS